MANENVNNGFRQAGAGKDNTLFIGGTDVTASATELNIMDGVTATTAELNIMDGVTATTAELNIMDGVTATTAELNIMDGVTSTTAEINKLDGVASTTTEIDQRALTVALADISTASSAFVVSPYTGNVTKVYSVIDGAIASADANLTTSIGGVSITSGGFTIGYSGSAAGDVDSATPSANNAVSAGDALSVTTDGGSTNTVKSNVTFLIQIT